MEVHSESSTDENSSASSLPSNEGKPSCCYMILLPSHDRTRAVVEVHQNTSVRLPTMPVCPYFYQKSFVRNVEDWIESFLGVKVRFVRELWATKYAGEKQYYTLWGEQFNFIAVLLAEWAEAEKSVDCERHTKWMSLLQMEKANWVEAEKELGLDMRKVVTETMKVINGTVHVRIPQWRRMGWFARMTRWVKEVTNCDIDEQELYRSFVKITDHRFSAVWVCHLDLSKSKHSSGSTRECVYMKAALPLLREVERTVAIARVLKEIGIVPELIAFNEVDSIFMQRSGGDMECDGEEIDVRVLVDTISRMQLLSMAHLNELKAAGLQVRDSEWLESNIHDILYHKGLDKAVQGHKAHREIVLDLRCREEKVKEVCRKISSYGIPNTLVHGDAREHNFGSLEMLEGRGYPLFDWGYSHIGNPFLDIQDIDHLTSNLEKRCNEPLSREHWKCWKSKVNEEDFLTLLSIVPVIRAALFVEKCEREAESDDVEWYDLGEVLRESAELLRNRMDDVEASLKASEKR
eukprot:TRINITY_DN78355_c0_g1_i1.p1 TRINITY_DN78355_c0_g1~~TRINITY_DN78355_c0_g1_i1.p1  ORF type:complete len:519 (+),score=71.34 TRINITY_DN78355_c0_g1_i1:1206-2762(+)